MRERGVRSCGKLSASGRSAARPKNLFAGNLHAFPTRSPNRHACRPVDARAGACHGWTACSPNSRFHQSPQEPGRGKSPGFAPRPPWRSGWRWSRPGRSGGATPRRPFEGGARAPRFAAGAARRTGEPGSGGWPARFRAEAPGGTPIRATRSARSCRGRGTAATARCTHAAGPCGCARARTGSPRGARGCRESGGSPSECRPRGPGRSGAGAGRRGGSSIRRWASPPWSGSAAGPACTGTASTFPARTAGGTAARETGGAVGAARPLPRPGDWVPACGAAAR